MDDILELEQRVANMVERAEQAEAEVRRLQAVLDGMAPAEGSWQTEALALRAEARRLREELAKRIDVGWGADRAELTVLRARDEAAKPVVREAARWIREFRLFRQANLKTHVDGGGTFQDAFDREDALEARRVEVLAALDELARVYADGGRDR